MDYHQNARLTAIGREQMARMVLSTGCTFKAAAAEFKVSPRTAAKWVRRYQAHGAAGLADLSSRPHRSPRQMPSALLERVLSLRRQYTPGYQIALRCGVSPSSVSRALRRARLSRWRDLHPRPPVVRRFHDKSVLREIVAHQRTEVRVVLNQKDRLRGAAGFDFRHGTLYL